MAPNTITLDQSRNRNANKTTFFEAHDLKAGSIPRQVIKNVTKHAEIIDVRTFPGSDNELSPHLMIAGTDTDGDNLTTSERGSFIYNFVKLYPNRCSKTAPFINE